MQIPREKKNKQKTNFESVVFIVACNEIGKDSFQGVFYDLLTIHRLAQGHERILQRRLVGYNILKYEAGS